jgi:hypothetical protein
VRERKREENKNSCFFSRWREKNRSKKKGETLKFFFDRNIKLTKNQKNLGNQKILNDKLGEKKTMLRENKQC